MARLSGAARRKLKRGRVSAFTPEQVRAMRQQEARGRTTFADAWTVRPNDDGKGNSTCKVIGDYRKEEGLERLQATLAKQEAARKRETSRL